MQTTRFALLLVAFAFALTMTTAIGCSGAESTTSSKDPSTPSDVEEENGGVEQTSADAGTARDSGGPRHDGGSVDAAATTATCATRGAKALSIDPNHGAPHAMADLPPEDFVSTSIADKQYPLTAGGGGGGGGSGQHTHTLTLTGVERAKLARGETLAKASSAGGNNAHTHTVTLGCK